MQIKTESGRKIVSFMLLLQIPQAKYDTSGYLVLTWKNYYVHSSKATDWEH